jgi:hypothetical protein
MSSLELSPTLQTIPEHDCPYEKRVENYREHMEQSLGYGALNVTQLNKFVESLHIPDGECPPTHGDNGPTREWEDVLDRTFY